MDDINNGYELFLKNKSTENDKYPEIMGLYV